MRSVTSYIESSYSYGKSYLWTPLYYGIESYVRLRKICGDQLLIKWAFLPTAASLVMSYGLYRAQLWQSAMGDEVFGHYLELGKDDANESGKDRFYDEFFPQLMMFGASYIASSAISVIEQGIQKYAKLMLSKELIIKYHERMFAGDNFLALTNQAALPKFRHTEDDAVFLIENASDFITSGLTSAILAGVSFTALVSTSIQIPMVLFAWGMFGTYVSSKILARTVEINNDRVRENTSYHAFRQHNLHYPQNIAALDGFEYSRDVLDNKINIVYGYKLKLELYNTLNTVCEHIIGVANFMLRWGLLGYNVHIGAIKPDFKSVVEVSSQKFSEFLNWNSEHAQSILFASTTIQRLDEMINTIEQNESKTNKVIIDFSRAGQKIVFSDDLRLGILGAANGKNLVENKKEVELAVGKRYCLVAPSGQGKTTLLYAAKGIVPNGILACGTVRYPFEDRNKLVMIPQQDYFPREVTLFEILCYPNKPKDGDREKVFSLMDELMIDAENNGGVSLRTRLDQKGDWDNTLSGGQKKKVKLISAILRKPEVLLLDETFAGLDPVSIIKACAVIQRELPNTTIIMVDHNYKHLPEGFVTDELELTRFQSGMKRD